MMNQHQQIPLAVLDNGMLALTKIAKATLLDELASFCSNGGESFNNLEDTETIDTHVHSG